MTLFLRLAWRNILRNKRRTFIAGTAIGIGLAAMIFVDALFEGMMRHMIRSATASYMGEAQVHRRGFRDTFDAALTINDLDGLIDRLDTDPLVKHYTVRTTSFAMLASSANNTGVSLVGTQPDRERHLSQVADAVVEGTFLSDPAGQRPVLAHATNFETKSVDCENRDRFPGLSEPVRLCPPARDRGHGREDAGRQPGRRHRGLRRARQHRGHARNAHESPPLALRTAGVRLRLRRCR